MAGSLVAIERERQEKSVTGIRDEWEVQYSRFFNYPSLSSACPSPFLTLLSDARRCRSRGTWISSSSSAASLKLRHPDHSISSDLILILMIQAKIHEEHYVSNLHFSWPQVCCLSGFPARGSLVVFVSYKDCVGQIQKFALRFLTINETERFMNALKEILKDEKVNRLPSGDFESNNSSQSEFLPSNGPVYRYGEDWSSINSAGELPQSLNCEVAGDLKFKEAILHRDTEQKFPALPPSFASLLTNSCSEHKEAEAWPTVPLPEEIDLKFHISKYLEDSSFQDMLIKVEKYISEFGDDLLMSSVTMRP